MSTDIGVPKSLARFELLPSLEQHIDEATARLRVLLPDKPARKLVVESARHGHQEPSEETLAQYAPKALKRRRTTGSGLKATTAAIYERYVRQDIVPSRLGEMKLTDIRRSHINAWIADLTKTGHGAVTVRRALAVLQMIFSTPVRDEIIPATPASKDDKTSPPCLIIQSPPGSLSTSRSSSSGQAITASARCSS